MKLQATISQNKLYYKNTKQYEWVLLGLGKDYQEVAVEVTIKKPNNSRTSQQNKALHLFFKLVSEALNNAGLDIKATLKSEIDIPWSPELVKELMWKTVQKMVVNKKSTASLTNEELNKIYDVFNQAMANKGLHVPFPSIENLMSENL